MWMANRGEYGRVYIGATGMGYIGWLWEGICVHQVDEIFAGLDDRQKDFLAFVLSKYIETGVGELDQDKLPSLLELKYHSIPDATEAPGMSHQ